MDDIKTFVLLKYEILTSDSNTWHLCGTYPDEVRSKWAWRCAADVEHLANGNNGAMECIRVAKLYRDGLATKDELKQAWYSADAANYPAAYYAYTAAYSATQSYYAVTADEAASATEAANVNAGYGHKAEEKWNLYIEWLIEELCGYEKNHE